MNQCKKNRIMLIMRSIYLFCLCGLFGISSPTFSHASQLVECRYLKVQGQEIQVEVNISSPPPATVIIIQNLPADVSITHSSPPVKKFNRKQGEAKWLLKGIKPGTTKIAMHLDRPISPPEISGEIRYKDPVTGGMIKIPFKP